MTCTGSLEEVEMAETTDRSNETEPLVGQHAEEPTRPALDHDSYDSWLRGPREQYQTCVSLNLATDSCPVTKQRQSIYAAVLVGTK